MGIANKACRVACTHGMQSATADVHQKEREGGREALCWVSWGLLTYLRAANERECTARRYSVLKESILHYAP